jgi:hypothetical protein
MCDYGGKKVTCRRRVQWAAEHEFEGKEHSCVLALSFVMDYCKQCASCPMNQAGCVEGDLSVSRDGQASDWLRPAQPGGGDEGGDAPTTTFPFDCQFGYKNWEKGWSDDKKEWCCEKYEVACPANFSLPFDCEAGYANWQRGWSVDKKIWCCRRHRKGCLFDCQDGLQRWERAWSKDKKAWCCENENLGCLHNCSNGFGSWQSTWPDEKKEWCCKYKRRGCVLTSKAPAITMAPPTSSQAGAYAPYG